MRFKNKVVLVTGAVENTGFHIASLFLKEGARVVINGADKRLTQSAAERLTHLGLPNHFPIVADIADAEQVKRMFSTIESQFGRIDVLVNNAAHQGIGDGFGDMAIDFFKEVIQVNLLGTFMVSQHAVNLMLAKHTKGVIVNIGSNVSTRAIHKRTAYIASKGGLDALTNSMATDLGPKGIRVNMVAPGYINTDRWEKQTMEAVNRRRRNIPIGRESTGVDIAEAVAFLASDTVTSLNGARLVVDGGCSAQHLPEDVDV